MRYTTYDRRETGEDVVSALDAPNARLRHPAARIAADLARTIRREHPDAATGLLQKVLGATIEEAVLVDAKMLLAQNAK